MKFNENYEKILGSKPKLKLLKHVLSAGFEASGRELARMTGLSHMTVNRNMKYFYNINLVKLKRYGRTFAWSANEESYLYPKLKTVIKDMLEIEPLHYLRELLLTNLKMPGIISARLFGSISKGKEKDDSDIDLFVIVGNEGAKKTVVDSLEKTGLKCMRVFGNSLSPYVLTESEYAAKRNKLAVVAEAEKGIKLI